MFDNAVNGPSKLQFAKQQAQFFLTPADEHSFLVYPVGNIP